MATGLPPELIAALSQQQAGGMPPPHPAAPGGLPPELLAAMARIGGPPPGVGPAGPLGPPAFIGDAAQRSIVPVHPHAGLRRPKAPVGPAGLAGALRSLVP